MANSNLESRAQLFAGKFPSVTVDFENPLGHGTDGSVWKTNRKSAVKVFERQKNYDMEIGCYQRLSLHKITNIEGFSIPRLIHWDDTLLVIEMQLVTPPYMLDFGKAYVDWCPEHSPEQEDDFNQEQEELWGHYLPQVRSLLWHLRNIGIYYRDPKPGNIMFEDWDGSA